MNDNPLARMQARAQADADRHFGDGPVAPWQPLSAVQAPTPWRWRPWLAAAAGLALAALAAGAAWRGALDSRPEPTQDVVEALPALPLPPRPAPAAPVVAPASTLNIARQGAEWRIDAVGVTRLAAAQRLAQASGSSLSGDVAPLALGRPLQLQWHGRDVATAWQLVLGSGVSFATQCSAARCRVWVVDAGTLAPEAASAQPSAKPLATPAAPDTALNASPPPTPSDSADSRVAAHHD